MKMTIKMLLTCLACTILANSYAQDIDGDGVPDTVDNCSQTANPAQLDADADLFGNACDGDFNNDGATNFIDFATLAAAFLTVNPLLDMNGDGIINFLDITIFVPLFNTAPGPGPFGAGYASLVQPTLATKCAPCHTGLSFGGHNIGTTYADSFNAAAHPSCVGLNVGQCTIVRIQAGQMPQAVGCSGNPITDAGNPSCLTYDEQILVASWINGGLLP